MTRKADFNAEDWSTIVDGPLYAGTRVIAAARGGTLRETLAMGQVYQQARQRHGASDLLDEIVASPPSVDPRRLQATGQDPSAAVTHQLQAAIRILQATATPAEVDDYKTFVMTLAQAVAEAHREGGLFGLRHRPEISEAENQALDEIADALGEPPAGAIEGSGQAGPPRPGD